MGVLSWVVSVPLVIAMGRWVELKLRGMKAVVVRVHLWTTVWVGLRVVVMLSWVYIPVI